MKKITLPNFGLPKALQIEPIQNCNFRCTMCHVSTMDLNKEALNINFLNDLPYMKDAYVRVGASFEPTLHKDFAKIVNILSQKGMKINLTTNGSLLTKKLIEEIKDVPFNRITFSFDTINKQNYENIRINANYNKVLNRFLNFKNSLLSKTTIFNVNSTILKENMEDIMNTVEFFEKEDFNSITLTAAVKRSDDILNDNDFIYPFLKRYKEIIISTLKKSINDKYNISIISPIINENNFYKESEKEICQYILKKTSSSIKKQEYIEILQRGEIEGMPLNCTSPFTFAEIIYTGDVRLCNKFYIGNITNESFENIWFSKEANYVRKKIMENKEICYSCSFYKFCINSKNLDYKSSDNQSDINNKMKEPPIINIKPEKVQTIKNFNIIKWLDIYYAVPSKISEISITTSPKILEENKEITSNIELNILLNNIKKE